MGRGQLSEGESPGGRRAGTLTRRIVEMLKLRLIFISYIILVSVLVFFSRNIQIITQIGVMLLCAISQIKNLSSHFLMKVWTLSSLFLFCQQFTQTSKSKWFYRLYSSRCIHQKKFYTLLGCRHHHYHHCYCVPVIVYWCRWQCTRNCFPQVQ